jgi:hypothetical protein
MQWLCNVIHHFESQRKILTTSIPVLGHYQSTTPSYAQRLSISSLRIFFDGLLRSKFTPFGRLLSTEPQIFEYLNLHEPSQGSPVDGKVEFLLGTPKHIV